MIDPIGGISVDPVIRLRDRTLSIQQPERERIAAEIERFRAALEPLAVIPLWSDAYPDCTIDHVAESHLCRISVAAVKAARAALTAAHEQKVPSE